MIGSDRVHVIGRQINAAERATDLHCVRRRCQFHTPLSQRFNVNETDVIICSKTY